MLSDKQYFQGKYFLSLYKDSLLCAEQTSKKLEILSFHKKFYQNLSESYTQNQISFDIKGHIQRTSSTKSSYYYRLFELSEEFVGRKIDYNKSYNEAEFFALLKVIQTSLQQEINSLQNNSKPQIT